jgi:hypothetical protein
MPTFDEDYFSGIAEKGKEKCLVWDRGEREGKMPRHVLTLQEQRAGIEAALDSRKTPRHFRPGLKRRLKELDRKLGKGGRGKKPHFLGWLQF